MEPEHAARKERLMLPETAQERLKFTREKTLLP
jgi:hypothetical protein